MARATYCYCKNTYSINCEGANGGRCDAPYYWKQGIGNISGVPPVFDETFDESFN